MRFLIALSLLLGSIDMTPDNYVLSSASYQSRFGYVAPGYMDWIGGQWSVPCRDFMFLSGNTSPYGKNSVTIYFYNGETQVGTKTVTYGPDEFVFFYTPYTYNRAVMINGDGVPDVARVMYCWWYY